MYTQALRDELYARLAALEERIAAIVDDHEEEIEAKIAERRAAVLKKAADAAELAANPPKGEDAKAADEVELDTPKMFPIDSSNLFAIGHDGRSLFVTFRDKDGNDGATWKYGDAAKPVPADELVNVMNGGGSYFAANIKDAYPATMVEPDPEHMVGYSRPAPGAAPAPETELDERHEDVGRSGRTPAHSNA
jgi:hypothetical protein